MPDRYDPSTFIVPTAFWLRLEVRTVLAARDMGSLFRLLRKYAGASQTGLMMRTGVAKSEISAIMTGQRRVISLERFEAIANGLGMPDSARATLGLAPATASISTYGTPVGELLVVEDLAIRLKPGRIFPGAGLPVKREQENKINSHLYVEHIDDEITLRRGSSRHSYSLGDLSAGLLWAMANLEDSLLQDDAALDSTRQQLRTYEALPGSAVSREAAPDLSAISRLWLGSEFSARHVLANSRDLASSSVFWTSEHCGEEASMWLFFRHKLTYLYETVRVMPPGEPLVRNFCVPQSVIEQSGRSERILLLLAVTLMEALGIEVRIVDEPDLLDTEGFVLFSDGALVADWLTGSSLWHVDRLTDARSIRALREKVHFAEERSILASAANAQERLKLLAVYLGIDWAWITLEADRLLEADLRGLIRPRSRLVSPDGVETALVFLTQHAERSR